MGKRFAKRRDEELARFVGAFGPVWERAEKANFPFEARVIHGEFPHGARFACTVAVSYVPDGNQMCYRAEVAGMAVSDYGIYSFRLLPGLGVTEMDALYSLFREYAEKGAIWTTSSDAQ